MSTINVAANLESLAEIRHWLLGFFKDNGYTNADKSYEWELVIVETLTNIIEHGNIKDSNSSIELTVEFEFSNVVLTVRDNGEHYDFHALKGNTSEKIKSERPPGGMGIFLIRKLVDKVEQSILADGRNQLVLIKQS